VGSRVYQGAVCDDSNEFWLVESYEDWASDTGSMDANVLTRQAF
jgi:hypothetical protein